MYEDFKTIFFQKENYIAHIQLNNPDKANAMTEDFWKEIKLVMENIQLDSGVRVVVISGAGKHFSAGIDLSMLAGLQKWMTSKEDQGRTREKLRTWIKELQSSFTAIEQCSKPIIAAVHGACIGGAIDMISACDMRYCCENSRFCVKEIDLGIVADVGTLQRLPKIIPEGVARELAYTARTVNGQEARQIHLVNECYATQEEMMKEVLKIAETIADKSPLSVRGTKEMLNYTQNHSIEEGLNYVATWNAAMLFSNDVTEAMTASMQKRKPNFEN